MSHSKFDKPSESPFHQGEQSIQQKMGVREKMKRFAQQVIRNYLPEQYQKFFAQLPFVFVGHTDNQGWPWASILFEQPGFISSADNKHLRINADPVDGDPLAHSLAIGKRMGLLGIELETRRRNRISSHISQILDKGIELTVDQAFGNCPQYIQTRKLHVIDYQSMPPKSTELLNKLDDNAIKLINNSDTFFVASFINHEENAENSGADVSHRGGKPGFIRIDDAQTLTIPDYLGNFHFNTLGNFLLYPKAGLLFIDFEQGHLLTLTGSVEILWDSAETEFFTGAERLWKFHLDHGYRLNNVLPLRWHLEEYSPNTTLTGSWIEASLAKKAEALKHSWQPYQVTKIIKESSVIKSFYLQAPADQKPQFLPGQFLTLKAIIDGQEQIRNYTVSSATSDDFLRISVKHERGDDDKSEGIFSSFLHRQIAVGDILQTKAPQGIFTFDTSEKHPAVLISAGIGITPMIAMARYALNEGIRTRSMRSITLVCCARNASQRAFFNELNTLSESSSGFIRVFWALTQPEDYLQLNIDYHFYGRLSKQLLQTILPNQECDVYLCGPNSFMQNQYDSLCELKVSDAHIYTEAFGPSSLTRVEDTTSEDHDQTLIAEEAIIKFTTSGVEQAWSKKEGTILEFAETHGLTPNYGCRNGKCGSCKAKLLSGEIVYKQSISAALDEGEILICCAMPAKELDQFPSKLEIQL